MLSRIYNRWRLRVKPDQPDWYTSPLEGIVECAETSDDGDLYPKPEPAGDPTGSQEQAGWNIRQTFPRDNKERLETVRKDWHCILVTQIMRHKFPTPSQS